MKNITKNHPPTRCIIKTKPNNKNQTHPRSFLTPGGKTRCKCTIKKLILIYVNTKTKWQKNLHYLRRKQISFIRANFIYSDRRLNAHPAENNQPKNKLITNLVEFNVSLHKYTATQNNTYQQNTQ